MPRIVDADSDRNERNININERINQSTALAEFFKAMPWFIWALPGWILAGLICLAIGHEGLDGFTNSVMNWLSLVPWVLGVLCGIKAFVWGHNTFNKVRTDVYNRRLLAANAQKAQESVLTVQYKNESLLADVKIRNQIPGLLAHLAANGVPFRYDAKGNLEVLGVPGTRVTEMFSQGQIGAGAAGALPAPAGVMPDVVLYEDIKGQVPKGFILVGISAKGIETKESAVGAMVWIVGLSGTGKTSTTVLRVEERATDGHGFMGVDPHWFKDDSLYHSIYETIDSKGTVVGPGPYADLFLMPMARTPEESKTVLQAFLDEFNGRKLGRIPKPWKKITILIDEVGAQMDPTTEEEEEIAKMLPTIARICGQEARNFNMGGVFISQQATGLAWLRKMALMVIVHQLLMESEKKLACNGNMEVAKEMEHWPIGRTYVYGVGFQKSGPIVVQQPYFAGRRVSAPSGGDHHQQEDDGSSVVDGDRALPGDTHTQEEQTNKVIPALSGGDLRVVYDACQQLLSLSQLVNSRDVARITGFGKDKANGLITRLEDMNYIPRRRKAV